MILKPYAAFGKVLTKNTYQDNEVFFAVIGEDISCTTFWVKGRFKNKNVTTGQVCEDYLPGKLFRKADYIPSTYEHTAVGETEVFCYDTKINNNEEINIETFYLNATGETLLPIGTKLFLCSGKLVVNNVEIDKPTQIRIKSEDTLVTAITDCYGLLFP